MTRVPSGHPEGYLEGFANIYSEVARAIRAARDGGKPDPAVMFPTVEDGLVGDGVRRGGARVEPQRERLGEAVGVGKGAVAPCPRASPQRDANATAWARPSAFVRPTFLNLAHRRCAASFTARNRS